MREQDEFSKKIDVAAREVFDYPILVSLHARIKNNSIYEPKVGRCLCVFHQVLVSSFGKICGFQERQKTGKMTLHLLQQTKILKCNLRNDSFSTHNETNGHFKMASNRFLNPFFPQYFKEVCGMILP